MKKFILFFVCFFCNLKGFDCSLHAYDLTLVGIIQHADGLGRIPIGLIEILKDEIEINCIPISIDPIGLKEEIKKIIINPNQTPGRVSLLTTALFWSPNHLFYQYVPRSQIKIAYSMFESTALPPRWVKVLNEKFDAVVVPDPYLIQVYKHSGVRIPIFMIPLGMDLDSFLEKEARAIPSIPFTFGASAAYSPRKNLSLIIQAFAEEFGNSPDVILKIHGRFGSVEPLQNLAKSLGVSNIVFSAESFAQEEYVELMNSFDCYINLSKGEGFSCCPREALALGIPCILSNNTAQKKLCDSGFVKSVPSLIEEPAFYGIEYYDSQRVGNQFNCNLIDVKQAMRDVYTHYAHYLQLAQSARQWVAQYSWDSLKLKYLNLIKPKKILLGKKNIITDSYLMTNSHSLYKKYERLKKNSASNKKSEFL